MSAPLVLEGNGGTVTITAGALERLARGAAEAVDGVRVCRRGLSVGPEGVQLAVAVRYGEVLPAVAEAVQDRVAAALREACELDAPVDVAVEEVR